MREVRRWWAALVLVAALWATAAAARGGGPTAPDAAPEPAPRVQFLAAWSAAQLGGDAWRSLAKGLEDYPLYPYLEAAALHRDLGHAEAARVEAFIKHHDGSVLARDLRRDWLHELGGRRDWDAFRALYRPGLGDALACGALRARLAAGEALNFKRDLATLWSRASLPAACQPVLDAAHDAGLLTLERLWARVETAAAAGRAGTVESLARWMPRGDAVVARRLVLARADPRKALREAAQWRDSEHTRMAVAVAAQRLARSDTATAERAWRELLPRFAFTPAQRNDVSADLALFRATDFTADAGRRLAALPEAAQTESTRTWRVRVALAAEDWPAVLAAIAALPDELAADSAWRYWKARALARSGDAAGARALFTALAAQADYYGFLAADWLKAPYAICPSTLAAMPEEDVALLAQPALMRAFELQAVGLLPQARREWNDAMTHLDAREQRLAADLASRRGWYDRAVFRFSSGEDLRLYAQRFPLAERELLTAQARRNDIDPAWAYAILRAESAWVADARSGANAWGLMQLLPTTGERTAKRLGLPWRGTASLLEPATNITLGTAYLAEMAARFDGSPWLAAAAYNAGPGKVDAWLGARAALPPDVFIDTIPYHETRAYVRRVLAFTVIHDWRLHDAARPLSTRMPPAGTAPPRTSDAARKAVSCPTA